MFKKLVLFLSVILLVGLSTTAFAGPTGENYRWTIFGVRGINNNTGEVDILPIEGVAPKRVDADYRTYDYVDVLVIINGEQHYKAKVFYGNDLIEPIEYGDITNEYIVTGQWRAYRIDTRSSQKIRISEEAQTKDSLFIFRGE